jgi:hypothetical protein
MQWFAATSKPNGERTAYERLCEERVICWYPRHRTHVLRHRRDGHSKPTRVWVEKPAYPRYLFLHVDTDRLWLARRCKVALVRFGEYPEPIPHPIMDVLRAGSDDTGLLASKIEVARARFQAMQQVRYPEGHPYRDLMVRVIEDDGSDFIRVMLTIFNSTHETTIAADMVQAA